MRKSNSRREITLVGLAVVRFPDSLRGEVKSVELAGFLDLSSWHRK